MPPDSRQLEATINSQVIEPYINLNYGIQKKYPRVTFPLSEPEDLDALTAGLKELVPLGLKVAASQVREKYGLCKPADDEEILGRTEEPEDSEAPASVALNSQQNNSVDELDDIYEDAEDWEQQLNPIMEPLSKLLAASNNEADFLEALPDLFQEFDATELVTQLAIATFKSRSVGNE